MRSPPSILLIIDLEQATRCASSACVRPSALRWSLTHCPNVRRPSGWAVITPDFTSILIPGCESASALTQQDLPRHSQRAHGRFRYINNVFKCQVLNLTGTLECLFEI